MKYRILGLLCAGLLLFACTPEEETNFQLSDWVGNWKITNQKEILTKASQGSILINPTKPNTILINGSLFSLNKSIEIEGTVDMANGRSIDFDYQGNIHISGTGTMQESGKIEFLYNINDNADYTRYMATAYKITQ